MEKIVFLNGRFLPQSRAMLAVVSPGLLYGWGLFETMRSYSSNIVYLNSHLRRIKDSCKLINISFPYSLSRLREYIEKTVKINGFQDAYVRLTLLKSQGEETDTLIIVNKYEPFPAGKYKQGFSCSISGLKQNEKSFLANLKTTNYLLLRLSYSLAKDKGFDEAIILNSRGYLAEGSRSNIFFVKNNEVFTPALECGCLDGITRRVIFDIAKKYNIKIYPGSFILQDLYKADEAFLTNSLLGVMPLSSIESRPLGKVKSGYRITKFFMERYDLLSRKLPSPPTADSAIT